MRIHACLLIAIAAGLSSCGKVKDVVKELAAKRSAKAGTSGDGPAATSTGALVSEITEADFDSFSKQPGRVVVIDFHAEWCGPCRQLAPILERVASEHAGKVVVGKINVDHAPSLASREGVRSIPDVRIFRDGRQVDKFVGLPPESEVRRRITSHTEGLSAITADAAPAGAPEPAEPAVRPMDKDWLPPGMQRR